MKTNSKRRIAAVLALLASSLLHVAAMAIAPEFAAEVLIEGSASEQSAALGSDFADLVKMGDELAPVEAEDPEEPTPPLEVRQVTPVETRDTTPIDTPREVTEPVTPRTPPVSSPLPVQVEATDAQSLVALAPADPLEVTAPEIAAVTPPVIEPDPVQPEEIEPQVKPVVPAATVVPVPRPKPVIEPVKERPEKKKVEKRKKASAGNSKSKSKVNNKSGSQSGNKDSKSKSSGKSEQASNSREAGNAAASNYPGKVYARIARTRQRNAGGSGTAHVRFNVTANGQISGVTIARSSGNARIDRAALALVKRAAPFPKPPPGARTRFVIPVEFRR